MKHFKLLLAMFVLLWTSQIGIAQAATHSLGSNIISSNGTVWTITTENSKTVRRPYTSAGAFLSYSYNNWSNVANASADDLKLPIGTFVKPREGTLMCADRGTEKGTCYLITQGEKAGFVSEAIFKGLGFSFKYALYGDVSFLKVAPNITSSSTAHLPGTIINRSGTVYLVTPDGIRAFPTMTILMSWGYWDGDIIPANSYDQLIKKLENLPLRKAGEISPYIPITTPIIPADPYFSIITTSLPDGAVGRPYSANVEFTYNAGSVEYALNATFTGLPPGINTGSSALAIPHVSSTTDNTERAYVALSGTPTTAGTYKATLKLTDGKSAQISKDFTIVVRSTSTDQLSFNTNSLPKGIVSLPYTATVSFNNTSGKALNALISGQPSGIGFSGVSGPNENKGIIGQNTSISGTPSTAKIYKMIMTLTDQGTNTISRDYTITINPVAQLKFDLNTDDAITDADTEIESACLTDPNANCSIAKNDFNGNGTLDSGDITIISKAMLGNWDLIYDLTGDGMLNESDNEKEHACVLSTGSGCSVAKNDFNANGIVDSGDEIIIRYYIEQALK